jgi:hypothetical protein
MLHVILSTRSASSLCGLFPILLTFNAHVCHTGLGFLSRKNDRGHMTHQILVDYGQRPPGGEGYLRILEFLPDGNTVHVKSYSPLYDKYLRDAANQFTFQLDL